MKQYFEEQLRKRGRPKGVKDTKERKKHQTQQKIMDRKSKITEIFKLRTKYELGLTKFELISVYTGLNKNKILNLTNNELDYIWEEICNVRKVLNKEHLMSITSKAFPKATILNDKFSGFGDRILKDRTFVFWRCSTINDALQRKVYLVTIATGLYKSADDTMKTVELGEISDITLPPEPIKVGMKISKWGR